jgi:hypothetical protein
MTAFVPTQLGVLLPSDINDLAAAGFANGDFAKRVGGVWAGAQVVENSYYAPMPAFSLASFPFTVCGSGDNIITPTIPVGYKALIPAGMAGVSNPTSSNITMSYFLRRSSTNYFIGTISLSNSTFRAPPVVLEPGDGLVVNGSAPGLVVSGIYFLVPDTSNLKISLTFLNSGDNTLYTCPTGKQAILWGALPIGVGSFFSQVYNSSGGTLTVKWHHVPSGGAADGTNIFAYQTINANVVGQPTVPGQLFTAGESFVINMNNVGPCWTPTVIYEFDA